MKKIIINGYSLIEVLIALLILSFMLFGFDAMEIVSLRENRHAYLLSVADNQLNAMKERLYALKNYQGLTQQIELWNRQNQQVLPQGRGCVEGEFPRYVLTIFWGDNSQSSCDKNHIDQAGCLKQQVIV